MENRPSRLGVIPTPVRLDAHPDYTGRDMTIAFLDSGFQPHPDLTLPRNRILAIVDSNDPGSTAGASETPSAYDWHGTQTSVAAAGNGHMSNGLYRGLAYEANVVLVKIGEGGRISDDHIARGIEWVVENRERYGIRILNISAGGDEAIPYRSSVADQAAEEAVDRGITVVAAAGNSAFAENHLPMPPANAPSVITVGGYDDRNRLEGDIDLYRSSFGPTCDGLLKPEIIAPAAWVAAPILRNTPQARKAEALCRVAEASDADLAYAVRTEAKEAGLDESLADRPADEIRAAVEQALVDDKFVGAAYQHVDGTSFAAPVVSSVVAQMLDANPDLKPHAVKHILLSTADRLEGADVYRQGFGILRARDAVEGARSAPGGLPDAYFRPPHRDGDSTVFYFLDASAKSVALVGEFNRWDPSHTPFERMANGVWLARVPDGISTVFRYKFLVDGERWIEDPNNWLKEADGVGGLSSVLLLG